MKRSLAIAIGCISFFAIVATAVGLHLRAGDIIVVADGGFTPKKLPKHEDAPIKLHGGGKLSTVSGEIPPVLDSFTIEFDRHGSVDTTGLPVCTKSKLVATTTATARKLCPGAIVGKGFGKAVVAFPEQSPIPVSSPITIFNGPKVNGNYTVIAHAHLNYPGPATFIVPVVIEKIHKGVYGYRTKVKIPKIAGGAGHPISGSAKIGRIWTYKGKQHSFVNARCETGHLQARAEFVFKDGNILHGTFLRPCEVRN
jgi:hypothetical protein